MTFLPKTLVFTTFRTSHKPYFPRSVSPKIQRATRLIFYHIYLDMFPRCHRNFTVWIILEKKLLWKWWDDLKKTYLRKHHQKNLSFLEFRPSFVHFPQNCGLYILWWSQKTIGIQYSQLCLKWESCASYLYSPSSFLNNIFQVTLPTFLILGLTNF